MQNKNYNENEHRAYTRGIQKDFARIKIIIENLYKEPERVLEMPAQKLQDMTEAFDHELHCSDWKILRDKAAEQSGQVPASIDTSAKEIMLRYAKGFHLRSVVQDGIKYNHTPSSDPYRSFYCNKTNATNVTESYLGNITNEAQASLERNTNGDTQLAHDMLRHLIGKAMTICRTYGMEPRQTALAPACRNIPKVEEAMPLIKEYTKAHQEQFHDAFTHALPSMRVTQPKHDAPLQPPDSSHIGQS